MAPVDARIDCCTPERSLGFDPLLQADSADMAPAVLFSVVLPRSDASRPHASLPWHRVREAVTQAQDLVNCHFESVADGIPALPPCWSFVANYKIDIHPGRDLACSAWTASHIRRYQGEVRSVGCVRPQVS